MDLHQKDQVTSCQEMLRRFRSLVVVVAALLAPVVSHAAPIAITGVTLLDGNGGAPVSNAVIVIEGDRITAAGPAAKVSVPAAAKRLDAKGKYVIPGLMDANVHLFFGIIPEYLIRYDGRYDEIVLESAQIALKSGITTVFDTWGPREALASVRDKINAGQAVGSRIFFAGNIIGTSGPTSSDFLPVLRTVLNKEDADRYDAMWEQGVGPDLLWRTPAQVREAVRKYAQTSGVDFLKYLSSGHQEMQFIAFSPEVQRAIVEEGHKAGKTVQAHVTSPESLRLAIEAGVDILQHCDISGKEPIPAETIRIIAERKIPCAALLSTNRNVEWSASNSPPIVRGIGAVKDQNERNLIKAGAVILLTTDGGIHGTKARSNPLIGPFLAGVPDLPTELGKSHIFWIKAALERGMTPMQALMAGTRNIAQAYRHPELGTIEPGKRADLLILDADPLENPENYSKINAIYKDGRLVDRSALPRQRIMSDPAD